MEMQNCSDLLFSFTNYYQYLDNENTNDIIELQNINYKSVFDWFKSNVENFV